MRRAMLRAVLPGLSALLGLLPLFACSRPGETAAATAAPPAPPAPQRSQDPRVVELRRAIEFGRLDLARTLFDQVGSAAGAEAPLLRARLELLSGDAVAALRAVEEARAAAPADARVPAVAAEVYASLGRFEAAARELELGETLGGGQADLERATGVVLILQPGGGERGLAHLEAALALDPATPFLDRPLSQAHLLEGRRLLSQGGAKEALVHARAAAQHDPLELDVKELLADCLQVLNDFDEALALYEELEEGGKDTRALRADVHQRAGTFELFRKDRVKALEHYKQARALGLDDAGLGFGATLLKDEADAAVERGIAAYEAGDFEGARRAFEQALEVDTTHLAARNHLGVVLFHQQDYPGACAAWRAVLDAARAAGVELPEPVELNLARAQKLAGSPEEARATVEDFLRRSPESPFAPEAEEILRRL